MDQIFTGILQIIVSVVLAALIGLAIFVDKWQKGQEFKREKLVKTVSIGALIGLVACLANFLLTSGNYVTYLALNATAIALANPLIKASWRSLKDKFMGFGDGGNGGFPV